MPIQSLKFTSGDRNSNLAISLVTNSNTDSISHYFTHTAKLNISQWQASQAKCSSVDTIPECECDRQADRDILLQLLLFCSTC